MHVFTRPGHCLGSVQQVGDVWYHYCPHELDENFIDEIRAMCRSLVWHFSETQKQAGPFEVVHAHDWLAADAVRWIKQARAERRAVLTMHSTEYGRCGNSLWDGPSERIRECEWHGTYVADRVIAVSSIYPTVDSVGWGIGTLFTDFEWARWMGRNGRYAAETAFTWDIADERTERCYAV